MNTVFLSMDSNFIELLKRVNHATPIIAIIPSYTGEIHLSTEVATYYFSDLGLYIEIYTNKSDMEQDIWDNLENLDLYDGCDDQYYDYNPSIVESLIYFAHQSEPLERARIYQALLNKLRQFINDPEKQDDELWETYSWYANTCIANDSIEGLEGYKEYKTLKQSL